MSTVTIERLGLEGDGMAGEHAIPFSLPGERWEFDPPRLAGAPSPARATPPCPHFGTCGGCSLQHATDAYVAVWKGEVIARALAARGLETSIRPVDTSPLHSRRRAVFAGRRTRKTTVVGFHARRSETLVPIEDCAVVRPALLAAQPALHRLTMLCASRAGMPRFTVTVGPAGTDVAIGASRPLDVALRTALAAEAEASDLARLSVETEVVALRRAPFQPMGTAQVVPPPGAFLQATAEGETALVAAVREAIGPARRLADLFSGCGTFTLPLAEDAEVLAVEGAAPMLEALSNGWRKTPGLHRVVTGARDLFRRPLLEDELKGLDAVVIDPPRAGAEAQVRVLAACRRLGRVAMVSCNPVTFARDARLLVDGGFSLDWVQPVDQFRWAPHVEIVARLSRRTAG